MNDSVPVFLSKRARGFILLLLIAIAAIQSILLFRNNPHLTGLFSLSFWKNITRTGEIMLVVHRDYVDSGEVGFDTLREGALRGMVEGLDPYSSYFDPGEFDAFSLHTRQEYAGIGVEIREIEGRVVVSTIYPGTPAERAGLAPGDWIVEADGVPLIGLGLQEVAEKLRGPEDSLLELGVRPAGGEETEVRRLRREHISFSSVSEVEVLDGGIGYLRVTIFGEKTPDDLRDALEQLPPPDELNGLVLDLRNNPGGVLGSAVEFLEPFLPPGLTAVTVQGRDGRVIEPHLARRPAPYADVPVAVLLNRFSASASEVVAGALQAHGKGVVVGETSTGKGSVQSVFSLYGGEGLSLTTAVYALPDGRIVDGKGIEPDIPVAITEEDIRRESIHRLHEDLLSAEAFEAQFGVAPGEDKVLEAALTHLRDLR